MASLDYAPRTEILDLNEISGNFNTRRQRHIFSAEPAPWMFRALRPDELYTILSEGAMKSACEMMSEKDRGKCKGLTASQHVNSGSKASMKSDWISLTRSPQVAALWACRSNTGPLATKRDDTVDLSQTIVSGTSSGIFAAILTTGIPITEITRELVPGDTAFNSAMKSQEVLVKTSIPATITETDGEGKQRVKDRIVFYQSIEVGSEQYDAYEGLKYAGFKTTKDENERQNLKRVIIHNISASRFIYTYDHAVDRYNKMFKPWGITCKHIRALKTSLTSNALVKNPQYRTPLIQQSEPVIRPARAAEEVSMDRKINKRPSSDEMSEEPDEVEGQTVQKIKKHPKFATMSTEEQDAFLKFGMPPPNGGRRTRKYRMKRRTLKSHKRKRIKNQSM